ncbi:MAG TPA: threonine/serine exporter family protein [Acidimicrobiia bacterium]|nr:threonine/serine exporter family protein [Acidimicrobiia bacterium]
MNDDAGAIDAFIAELGVALIRSGETVDEVQAELLATARALGADDIEVMALPTLLMVQSSRGQHLRPRLRPISEAPLRLDQVGAVYDLLRRAQAGEVDPGRGIELLREFDAMRPSFGRVGRSFGLGVLAMGFSLMLQPTPGGAVIAFILGTLVGFVLTQGVEELRPVLPTLLSFLVAAAVFVLADVYDGANPIRTLIAPLVILLPGAAITGGTIELAAGETISGASRLVRGLVDLLLLALGITTAAALVGAPSIDLIDRPYQTLGPWVLGVGLVLIAAGYHFHMCAPRRAIPWILLVLVVAFAGQSLGAYFFSPDLSAFFGALVMTPVVLAVGRRPAGPPSMVLFLPGFYLLVPGATGLIGVTQTIGTGSNLSPSAFTPTMVTVAGIALGVLIGSAIMRSYWRFGASSTQRGVGPA